MAEICLQGVRQLGCSFLVEEDTISCQGEWIARSSFACYQDRVDLLRLIDQAYCKLVFASSE